MAWEALGHAVAAYEAAVTYALRREQFGRPLARFQLVQDKLSHMLADITAMQTMCTRMSQLQAEGRADLQHAALAKLATASAARRVCGMARDVLGGNGILLDHHVARHHADIEAVYTYEGTDSVQSLIVGRAITGPQRLRLTWCGSRSSGPAWSGCPWPPRCWQRGADVVCFERAGAPLTERSAGSSRIFRLAHGDAGAGGAGPDRAGRVRALAGARRPPR